MGEKHPGSASRSFGVEIIELRRITSLYSFALFSRFPIVPLFIQFITLFYFFLAVVRVCRNEDAFVLSVLFFFFCEPNLISSDYKMRLCPLLIRFVHLAHI